jgi:hypothetical protein
MHLLVCFVLNHSIVLVVRLHCFDIAKMAAVIIQCRYFILERLLAQWAVIEAPSEKEETKLTTKIATKWIDTQRMQSDRKLKIEMTCMHECDNVSYSSIDILYNTVEPH